MRARTFMYIESNVDPRFPLVLLVVASLAACTEKASPSAAKAPSAPATVVVTSSPPRAGSDVAPPSAADPNALDGAPVAVAFLRDGTMAVATDKEVAAIDAAGTMRRRPLSGRTAQLNGGFQAIALEGDSDIVLLETPSLRELFTGAGSALTHPTGAIVTRDQPPSVVMQIEGRAARFTLPPGKPKRVDGVDLTANRTLAVVTWAVEETMDADAAVFEVAMRRLVGRALPMGVFTSMRPVASIAGATQFGVEKRSVVVIDLKTGVVVRRGKPACPKDAFIGNPLVSPAGDFLLVTCGDDGIGLDPETLVQRRRYSKIMPGCDNGDVLTADYDPKKKAELGVGHRPA